MTKQHEHGQRAVAPTRAPDEDEHHAGRLGALQLARGSKDGTALVRRRLLEGYHLAVSTGREIVQHAQGEAGTSRAHDTISEVLAAAREIRPAVAELGPAERTELAPMAERLTSQVSSFGIGRPGLEGELWVLRHMLEEMFGVRFDLRRTRNDEIQERTAGQPGLMTASPEERLAMVRSALEAAGAELARAFAAAGKAGVTDLPGSGAIHDLALVRQLLRFSANGFLGEDVHEDSANRTKLQAPIEATTTKVRQLRRFYEGDRMQELAIRVDDIREGVNLDRGFSDEKALGALIEKQAGKAGPTTEQRAQFDALRGHLANKGSFLFEHRLNAIHTAEAEAGVKDPPKENPWWMDLVLDVAFTALTAASGGIAGALIEKLKNVSPATIDSIKKYAKKPVEVAWSKAKETAKAVAPGGGTGPGYFNALYFGSQRADLIGAKYRGDEELTEQVKELQKRLEEDPVQVLAEMQALSSLLGEGSELGEQVDNEQRAQTLAKFPVALARCAAGEVSGTDLGQSVGTEYSDQTGLKFEETVTGVVSLEFEPGKQPSHRIRIRSAWVAGVNQAVREVIRTQPLRRFPVRARALISADDVFVPPERESTDVAGRVEDWMERRSLESRMPDGPAVVARNEQGMVWGEGSGAGLAWLWLKAGKGDVDAAGHKAARKILDEEIGERSLEKLGVKEVGE